MPNDKLKPLSTSLLTVRIKIRKLSYDRPEQILVNCDDHLTNIESHRPYITIRFKRIGLFEHCINLIAELEIFLHPFGSFTLFHK